MKKKQPESLKGIKFKILFTSQTNLRVPLVNVRKSSRIESWGGNLKDMQFSIDGVGLSVLAEKFHSFTALERNRGFHKK